MKKLLLALLILVPVWLNAQNVIFDKPVYNAGDHITGVLFTASDGMDNPITSVSTGSMAEGTFDLGVVNQPGYYPATFKFGTNNEQYGIMVVPAGTDVGYFPPAIKPATAFDPRFQLFFDKLVEYKEESGAAAYLALFGRVVKNYAIAHPIDAPVTIAACIAQGYGQAEVSFYCTNGIKTLALDFPNIFFSSINDELFAHGKYGQDDYNFFKRTIATLNYGVNMYTTDGFLDTFSLIASVSGTALDSTTGDSVSYTASIAAQFKTKYNFIMKFKPKP